MLKNNRALVALLGLFALLVIYMLVLTKSRPAPYDVEKGEWFRLAALCREVLEADSSSSPMPFSSAIQLAIELERSHPELVSPNDSEFPFSPLVRRGTYRLISDEQCGLIAESLNTYDQNIGRVRFGLTNDLQVSLGPASQSIVTSCE